MTKTIPSVINNTPPVPAQEHIAFTSDSESDDDDPSYDTPHEHEEHEEKEEVYEYSDEEIVNIYIIIESDRKNTPSTVNNIPSISQEHSTYFSYIGAALLATSSLYLLRKHILKLYHATIATQGSLMQRIRKSMVTRRRIVKKKIRRLRAIYGSIINRDKTTRKT